MIRLRTLAPLALCLLVTAAVVAQPTNTPLARLADSGQFQKLLHQLKTQPDMQSVRGVDALISDLQRYHKNENQRQADRRAEFTDDLKTMNQRIQDGNTEKALVAAIQAQGVADDHEGFLDRPEIKQLTKDGEQAAQAAVNDSHWVDALSTYRLLNLLHDRSGKYLDPVKRAANHVRVLGLYAPGVLDKLYQSRADRLEEEKQANGAGDADTATDDATDDPDQVDEPAPVDHTKWTTQLDGVTPQILTETLAWAARKHVDQKGTNYGSLLAGGVNNLLVLMDTDALSQTFPSLGDKLKARRFRDYLIRTQHDLKQGPEPNVLEAETIVDKIFTMNTTTVDLPAKVIVYELTEGATSTLDDFSGVIWPHDLQQFSRSTRGKFYGIGIQISRRDGQLVVVSPLENTPAMNAGIKAGDVIASVDGKATSSWGLDRAVREITGPEGSKVTLGIERGADQKLEKTLRRAEIAIESIRGWQHKPLSKGGGWDYFIDRPDHIGYVRLSQFIPQTAEDLDAAVAQMQKAGPIHGLILDLRFNPGGLLDSAIDVVDRFVDKGPIVGTVDAQHRPTAAPAQAHKAGTYPDFPVVVLINQGSASASEITSGALQDYHRALIVGVRSFGKGSVQDLYALANRQALLKLTRQYYTLPDGRVIHRRPGAEDWGVHPDLKVEMTDQQVADAIEYRQKADVLHDGDAKPADTAAGLLEKGLDPQLETALLVLKTRVVAHDLAMAKAQ